jgi:BolA protein
MQGNRADRLTATLTAAFAPSVLSVTDDSAHHAGHVGSRGAAGQTHYGVLLVSASFRGMSRVARSRAVHAALAGEFGDLASGGMHALALTLRTPEEHAALTRAGG